jgi:hypothetical protein
MSAQAAPAALRLAALLGLSLLALPEASAQSSDRQRVAQREIGPGFSLSLDAGLSAPSGSLSLRSRLGLELAFSGMASLSLGLPFAVALVPAEEGSGVSASPGDLELCASARARGGDVHARAALSLAFPTGSSPGSGRGEPPRGSPDWRVGLDVELGLVRDPAALGLGIGLVLRLPRGGLLHLPSVGLDLGLSCAHALNDSLSISFGALLGLTCPVARGPPDLLFSGGAVVAMTLAMKALRFSVGVARSLGDSEGELRLGVSYERGGGA